MLKWEREDRGPRVLMTGAGFSRIFGGWLASEVFDWLLGAPQVNAELRRLLIAEKQGGFEVVLGKLQERDDPQAKDLRGRLESAIRDMFADMRGAFTPTFGDAMRDFLSDFDVIATLNQDSLLEERYCPHKPHAVLLGRSSDRSAPTSETDFHFDQNFQPILKLHGSADWEEGRTMVLGGGKAHFIQAQPVLSRLFSIFRGILSHPNARLVIVGYSFHDEHINDLLIESSQLELFIVDPQGIDAINWKGGQAWSGDQTESSLAVQLWPRCRGACRRDLRQVLAAGSSFEGEQGKIYRFLGLHN